MDCIFCKISKKEMPADIVYEDSEILGFKNIQPEAEIHLIFIPKKHREWKEDFIGEKSQILSKIILIAKKVAIEKGIFDACKFIFNVGKTGHIPHIHLHLMGGWRGKIPNKNI